MNSNHHVVVEGVVVVGDRRGRELGFPTANVLTDDGTDLPIDAVYAGYVERADHTVYLSAISLGRRPTYYEAGARLLEAHLLDFDGDLYGEVLKVTIVTEVRGQTRFSSSEELITQIRADVASVRSVLSGTDEGDATEHPAEGLA
jgi:FAD synthase